MTDFATKLQSFSALLKTLEPSIKEFSSTVELANDAITELSAALSTVCDDTESGV